MKEFGVESSGVEKMFFKSKAATRREELLKKREAKIAEMKEWRKLGQTFTYMDLTFSVIGHYHDYFGMYEINRVPMLIANYVNKNGEIAQISFDHHVWRELVDNGALY